MKMKKSVIFVKKGIAKKSQEEIAKNISYILHFIDNARFMASSLSNLVKNLSKGLHRIKCKMKKCKKCETCGIKYKYCNYFLEYTNFKDNLIEFKCLFCNRIAKESLMKN